MFIMVVSTCCSTITEYCLRQDKSMNILLTNRMQNAKPMRSRLMKTSFFVLNTEVEDKSNQVMEFVILIYLPSWFVYRKQSVAYFHSANASIVDNEPLTTAKIENADQCKSARKTLNLTRKNAINNTRISGNSGMTRPAVLVGQCGHSGQLNNDNCV